MKFAIGAPAPRRVTIPLWLCVFCLVLPVLADDGLAVLDVGSQVYSNVTVTSITHKHISIQHSRGFATLKIDDLSDETLLQLGFKIQPPKKPAAAQLLSSLKLPDLNQIITQTDETISIELNHRSFTLPKDLIKPILACLGMAYVIFCCAATMICRKSGLRPGIGCWIPIVQWGYLLRAAHMSVGWILLWIFPVTTLLVWVVWSVRICRALGKGPFTALFLILPVTTPLAFMYLALSQRQTQQYAESTRVQLAYEDAA